MPARALLEFVTLFEIHVIAEPNLRPIEPRPIRRGITETARVVGGDWHREFPLTTRTYRRDQAYSRTRDREGTRLFLSGEAFQVFSGKLQGLASPFRQTESI